MPVMGLLGSAQAGKLRKSAIFLKYPTFDNDFFSYFHGQKKYKVRVFVHNNKLRS